MVSSSAAGRTLQARWETVKRDLNLTHLGSLDLLRVLLRRVAQLEDVLLSEVGVVVKAELGVHAEGCELGRGSGRGAWCGVWDMSHLLAAVSLYPQLGVLRPS